MKVGADQSNFSGRDEAMLKRGKRDYQRN